MYINTIYNIVYLSDDINAEEDLINYPNLIVRESHDIVIGAEVQPNTSIELKLCDHVTIHTKGDVYASNSSGISIGEDSELIHIEGSQHITIGDRCSDVTISDSNSVVIENDNKNINISGNNCVVGESNSHSYIRGDYHELSNTVNVNIDNQSACVVMDDASGVVINGSLSTLIKNANGISITNTPEVTVEVSDFTLVNGAPRRIYKPSTEVGLCEVIDNKTQTVYTANKLGIITGQHGQPTLEAPTDGGYYVRCRGSWYKMVPDPTKAGGWDFIKSEEKQ